MEEVKNEILTLTKELREKLSQPSLEYLEVLEKLKQKVKKFNNEQVEKKFNGVASFLVNEDITIKENLNKALNYIDYFEESVEKNYQKDYSEILLTTEKFKEAIKNKNQEEIVYCTQEFIQYMKGLNDPNKVKMINNIIAPILSEITKKDIKDLTEEEINKLLNKANEITVIINDKVEKNEDKKDVPEDLVEIRKEMDKILGKSLFEGIENEYEFALSYQLDEYEIDKFQDLRKELKDLLADSIANKNRIDEIRVEMFIILGVDPYTYKDNKKIIEALEEPNKSRFAELKAKHDKLLENKLKTTKTEKTKKEKKEYNTIEDIRKRMAEILSKKNKKVEPYEGIEDTNVHQIDLELDENEKDEFQELQEKLKKLKKAEDDKKTNKPTGLTPVPPKTPVPTPGPKKKKGRLVKFAKSAKEFYKRHKKVILLVGGLVLGAIAFQALLPSIMQFNSIMWHKFIAEGALANTGMPKALNDINLLIGHKIGATYASGSGIWTLANGTLLNSGAAQASLLAAIGKVALSAGTVGVGATLAVKNAYRLAKEKIEKFRNREKKPKTKDNENKSNIFTNVKDSFAKGFEKGKEKVTGEWNKHKENKTNKNNQDNKKAAENTNPENKEFHRSDVSERINRVVNLLIDRDYISKTEKEELEKVDKETFMAKFKEIFNRYNIDSVKKDNKEDKVEFNRTDINFAVSEFIKYCYETGIYTDEDIKKINEMDKETLTNHVYSDPRFVEFEQMRTEWAKDQQEEKGKGL